MAALGQGILVGTVHRAWYPGAVIRRSCNRLVGAVIGALGALGALGACGFTASNGGDGGTGTTPDDSVIVDATPDAQLATACTAAGTSCVGPDERLRSCSASDAVPVDIICPWRCANTPMPHCRKLSPAGGGVVSADLETTGGLGDIVIATSGGPIRFDTDTGVITNGGQTVPPTGIVFVTRNRVGIWRFNSLTVSGLIQFTGTNAAALVAIDELQVTGLVDLQGDCNNRNAGAGGFDGAGNTQAAVGNGGGAAGTGGNTACPGGGGGGHAAPGGAGGGNPAGGIMFGTPAIALLTGGGGGGGGGGGNGGDGGGGGGAIQLVANAKVRINGNLLFGIQAGGCGGRTGAACGGGAGAGGTILVEAAVIEIINATLAVNGGGGGGGKSGTSGNPGHLSASRAAGGNGGTSGSGDDGGDGGSGGDNDVLFGAQGGGGNFAAGGGGAVGRMRFNTLSGSIVRQGVLFSPNISTTATGPVTQGIANLQ